jgi:hypothetical protein
MPIKIPTAGKPISVKAAKKYVEAYNRVKETLQAKILGPFRSTLKSTAPKADLKDALAHYESDYNAFIFSREIVNKALDPGVLGQHGDYLMILLASKYHGAEKGNPTVVIAGVKPDPDDESSFISLSVPYPADETPPHHVVPTFPGTRFDGQEIFKIKVIK